MARAREWHSRGHGFDSHHLQSRVEAVFERLVSALFFYINTAAGKVNMGNEDIFSGEIDPEIASLLGLEHDSQDSPPDYENLFDIESPDSDATQEISGEEEDITREEFILPEKYAKEPNPIFSNQNFYKSVLAGEGDVSNNLHTALSQFLKTTDPQEKQRVRTRLITQSWELFTRMSGKAGDWATEPKRLFLRYGFLLPNIVSGEQRKMLGSIIDENTSGEPIHYVDEWLEKVSAGIVSPLASDEARPSQRTQDQKVRIQLDKAKGSREAHLHTLQSLQVKRKQKEGILKQKAEEITRHTSNTIFKELESLYSEQQNRTLQDIMNISRELLQLHREMLNHYNQLNEADQSFRKFQDTARKMGNIMEVDRSVVEKEASSLRQMAKLCVGRQGNHIPVLMKQFFTSRIENVATRENVIRELHAIEQLDPNIFKRTFKQKTNRIVPHVILIPCYGDTGICWEPFERYNRSTSRGRIAIPLYPKSLKMAIIHAVADLRWQVAKEKAQHYWMEEGLTGHYYQYFSDKKMRGDVRQKFIEDYILWITKEGEGVQKLEKEVRGIFWRDMPFPQELKDRLRNRGFVYNELYKKDLNRAASDGY